MYKVVDKLKVVFVVTTVDGYGADKSILNNIIFLKRIGKIVPFVIIPKHGQIEKDLIREEIDYSIIKYNSWTKGPKYKKFPKLKRWSKKTVNYLLAYYTYLKHYNRIAGFDLVHTNTLTTFYGIFLSSILQVKHIMHIREIPFEQFHFEYEFPEEEVLELVAKSSSKVLCNSNYTLNYFSSRIDPVKLKLVPNPIFDTVDVLKRGCEAKTFKKMKFIIAGRYEGSKNQIDALEAVKILVEEGYVNFELHLFGNGPLLDSYKEFIINNNLLSFVFLNDYKKDLAKELCWFDVGLMCSRYEAFGRVAIEYMINGLPVIGNNTGNSPFLIKEDVNGLLYEFKNSKDLSQKMKYMITNPVKHKKMSKGAMEYVSDEFSFHRSSEIFIRELQK